MSQKTTKKLRSPSPRFFFADLWGVFFEFKCWVQSFWNKAYVIFSVCMELLSMTLVLALATFQVEILCAKGTKSCIFKLDGIPRKSPKCATELCFCFSFWFFLSHVPFMWVNLMIIHKTWIRVKSCNIFVAEFYPHSIKPVRVLNISSTSCLSKTFRSSGSFRRFQAKWKKIHQFFADSSTTIITTFSTTPDPNRNTKMNTLPETNSEFTPENGWLEDYLPFGKVYFQGRTVSFRESNEDPSRSTKHLWRVCHPLGWMRDRIWQTIHLCF